MVLKKTRNDIQIECRGRISGCGKRVADTYWLRQLLVELHSPISSATLIYCDNVSGVYMSANPIQHQITKHIDIDLHFVREKVSLGQVRVLHVPSSFQYADIFTNGLPSSLFNDFGSSLSIQVVPALIEVEILMGSRLANSIAFMTGYSCHRSRMMRSMLVRSSDIDSPLETSTATVTEEEESENPPVEMPKDPPSLISTLNVEKALRGIAITEVDHYGRLGISRGSPYDQVPIAYKNKVEELMKQELEEEELNNQLDQLKESYTILSSVEERRLYDWSLARSDQPDRYMWPFEADITQTPTETAPPGEPEDFGPTRAVGYFLLGWLILGFTLSIALNR